MINDLEERLINLNIQFITNSKSFRKDYVGQVYSKQLTRSLLSAALNYAEARAPESRMDFIHKISIALKELRESRTNLKIAIGGGILPESSNAMLDEVDQLIAILYSSKKTAAGKISSSI